MILSLISVLRWFDAAKRGRRHDVEHRRFNERFKQRGFQAGESACGETGPSSRCFGSEIDAERLMISRAACEAQQPDGNHMTREFGAAAKKLAAIVRRSM